MTAHGGLEIRNEAAALLDVARELRVEPRSVMAPAPFVASPDEPARHDEPHDRVGALQGLVDAQVPRDLDP